MSNRNRHTYGKGKENTGININYDNQSPAYAASIAIATKAEKTFVNVGQLTGALTLSIGVGNVGVTDNVPPHIGDEIDFLFSADAGAARVVTFGTGFASTGTLSVAISKYGSARFKFNGTVWIEVARAATA